MKSPAIAIGLMLITNVALAADVSAQIRAGAEAIQARVIAWRRDIHQHPELSNREFRTSKLVAEHLQSLGLEVTVGLPIRV